METICNRSECCGCTACRNICPRNAISMVEDENGFRYPKINSDICMNCNLCKIACPILNPKKDENSISKAYAAYNKDEKIRMQSSSGGVFTLIASEIIKKNGVVFGVGFDKNFFAAHEKAEKIEELEKFRSSKYMQSDLKDVYKQVKNFLEEDRYVLFTGTPCQIEGLKSYLKKDYKKLYTQDIICHGVPSKKVWEKYMEYKAKNVNDEIKNISFRNKENKGWNNYQVLFDYKKSKEYIDHSKDIFMKIFLKDIALRESCYNCKFKKENRNSDITLADFWGINNVLPEMNDEKGTSAIVINSEKGMKLFEAIKEKIIYKETEKNEIIKYNQCFIKSVNKNENRERFFKDLDKLTFEELENKYL